MQGLKVQCPNCKRKDFVTTDKFNPDIRPHGGMVKCLLPYHIDWLTTGTTLCAEMTCPECLAQLAPQGVLSVLIPARECGRFFEEVLPDDVQKANPVMSKSVERRLEAQTGKKRGKR